MIMKNIHIHLPARKKAADCKAKDATFPQWITHKGKEYSKTGKTGTDRKTGEQSAEYEMMTPEGRPSGTRLWMTASGKKTEDAGFDRREYSPREWNRLADKIKEVEASIKKASPEQKKNLEQELAKLKAEQAKYRTDDDWKTNHLGERTFRTFAAWKAACRAVNPSVQFEGDKDMCQAKPGVGEWDGDTGTLYKRTKDAGTTVQELEDKLDRLQSEIEALEDKGVTVPTSKLEERKKLQQQIMAAKLSKDADPLRGPENKQRRTDVEAKARQMIGKEVDGKFLAPGVTSAKITGVSSGDGGVFFHIAFTSGKENPVRGSTMVEVSRVKEFSY